MRFTSRVPRIFLLSIVLLESMLAGAASPTSLPPLPRASCIADCKTPFGTFLAYFAKTAVYSKCSPGCTPKVTEAPWQVPLRELSAEKNSSIDFVKRVFLNNFHVVVQPEPGYSFVESAGEVWFNLRRMQKVDRKRELIEGEYVEVKTLAAPLAEPPIPGDLLVFGKPWSNPQELPVEIVNPPPYARGHVAIVVRVDLNKGFIYLADQGLYNQVWRHRDYSWKIRIAFNPHTRTYVIGNGFQRPYVYGVKRVLLDKPIVFPKKTNGWVEWSRKLNSNRIFDLQSAFIDE